MTTFKNSFWANHNSFRPLFWAFLATAVMTLWLSGCSDNPINLQDNGNQPSPPGQATALGLMKITIGDIGSSHPTASAQTAAANDNSEFSNPTGGSINVQPISTGSFTYHDQSGGYRYIYAVYKVKNTGSQAAQNLTFLAIDNDKTYHHTAVYALRRFNGTEPDQARRIAKNIIPTGRVELNAAGHLISLYPDVLQVFTEKEVQTFEKDMTNPQVNDIFPYGFMVRTPGVTSGSRKLKANNQFDGRITFAFKVPLQPQANQDPFEITMMFLMVEDHQTRITRSIQEAKYGDKKAFSNRVDELDPTNITLLGIAPYNGSVSTRVICSARVAGPKKTPTASLGSPIENAGNLSRYYVVNNVCGNGSSWNSPFPTLQKALAAAGPGDQIWVAEGTYYPDDGTGSPNTRTSTFHLKNNIEIYGGFAPDKGADIFGERNWRKYETVLSGDLKQNDGSSYSDNSGNAYHVVKINGDAMLNGFTITGGNANSDTYPEHDGGGIFIDFNSSPALINLLITGNKALTGGGIYARGQSAVLLNVTISQNKAEGIYSYLSDLTIVNTKIVKNDGTAIYGSGNVSFELRNVTITGNNYFGLFLTNSSRNSTIEIYNSIMWGNGEGSIGTFGNGNNIDFTIKSSIVGGGCPDFGTIIACNNVWGNKNPGFKSSGSNYMLMSGSFAIDRGNNAFLPNDTYDLDGNGNRSEEIPVDLAGNPRIVDGPDGNSTATVDMGAYEYQKQ